MEGDQETDSLISLEILLDKLTAIESRMEDNFSNLHTQISELSNEFSNSLIIHQFTNQSGYANLVRCVWFETPMKHWTEAFPR